MVNVMAMFAGSLDHQKKVKYLLIIDRLLLFFLIILACLWSCHVADAADSMGDKLKVGDTLNSSSALVSARGRFTLLFLPNGSSSNYMYLNIRRHNVTGANKAWVANRDSPVLYPFGVLTLDSNNTLKIITNNTGGVGDSPIVLGSAPKSSSNVVATLLDSGNFMLQELNSDGLTKQVWWQSFDYPTDTFLPGMKLGVNHSNGHIWSLTSWTSTYYPPAGAFTLGWDPYSRQLEIRGRGTVYWRSRNYNPSNNSFENIIQDHRLVFQYSIVSNENEEYLTIITNDDPNSEIVEWMLNLDGRLFNYYGTALNIARADKCEGKDTDGLGCQTTDSCKTDFGYQFQQKKGYFKPIISSSTSRCPFGLKDVSNSTYNGTSSDCEDTCRQNCDCLGFDFLFEYPTGCRFWSLDCKFFEDSTQPGNASSFVRSMAPTSSPSNNSATTKWIWIGAATSTTLVVIAFCILCHLRRRRKSEQSSEYEIDQHTLLVREHDLSIFSYASIMAATCNFSEENKLGEGGFGPVYKGKLPTGQEIAVKRLSKCSGQGMLEFRNELILIYELRHTNLVQLFGFCIHGEERMLIYEYMPNKSLDYFLFDTTEGFLLDWHKRFSIIEGITQGLLYLHKYSRKRVVHRDLKASNVLLDKSLNPKISDFGLARIFTHNELEVNTGRIVGTLGYMPPEYAMNGIFSIKSDVYSFGVLMLEILSGRKNNSFYNDDRVLNLVGHAWELWKEGAALQLMDSKLSGSCNKNQFLRCVNVGLLCVGDNAANRPTMSEVISMLSNESVPLPEPTKPSFCTEEVIISAIVGDKPQVGSINGMTISNMYGR